MSEDKSTEIVVELSEIDVELEEFDSMGAAREDVESAIIDAAHTVIAQYRAEGRVAEAYEISLLLP